MPLVSVWNGFIYFDGWLESLEGCLISLNFIIGISVIMKILTNVCSTFVPQSFRSI